jgi:23S rRNA pseudouridine955/2504/2580 synthase
VNARQPAKTGKPAKPEPTKAPAEQTGAAQSSPVQTLPVSEDEDGMRLDRWFRRRFPLMGLSHLNKICRKGEVRVDGKRVEGSDRLKAGALVRVPPMKLEVGAPAVKRAPEASPQDVKLIRQITLKTAS